MNKKIRFSLLTLLVMLCGTVYADYQKVTATADITDGDYLIVYEAENVAFNGALETLDAASNTVAVTISDGIISSTAAIDAAVFTFDTTDKSIKSASGFYVGAGQSYSNGLKQSASLTDQFKHTSFAIDNGNVIITKTLSDGDMILNYNSNSSDKRFRYYKAGSQKKIQLYKKITSGGESNAYTVDFNTPIAVPSSNTASPVFQVSIGWTRIAPSAAGDGYGPYYMRYNYSADQGVDGTGALLANAQCAPQSTYDGSIETVNDYLVTPKVSGTVTLQVKGSSSANSTYPSFVKFFAIDDDATTVGNEIEATLSGDINNDEYVTATLTLTDATRLAIRAQWVYMDNFTATAAEVPEVKSLTVASVMNMEGKEGTGGTTTYFEQQADGTLSVPLKVLLSNTGNIDLVAGTTENYTLTLATASYASGAKTYYDDATVNVPVSLAAGESDTVEVSFNIPYATGWKYYFVKENISGTTSSSSRYAGVTAYEPKFVFRAFESTSTSSLSGAQAYGLVSEETTKSYEIANTGTAPLTIKSITLPEGFTSANMPEIPADGLVIAKGAVQALDITLPATTTGAYSGNLTIVYLDKNSAEQTFTLAFSGNVLAAGTWAADFNGEDAIAYPAGSVAEGGINSEYQYNDGAYNYYIKGRTSSSYASGSNMFITPKLHATAGQQLTFDVKGSYGSSYYAKVYVSTDRKTWGEPVAYFTYGETEGAVAIGSSDWVNKAITFDAEGDYYVAFSLYGEFKIDNIIGLTKVDVAHDLYIKSINWPDASIKTGVSQSKPSLDVIPLTDEAADAYTVKYVCGETVLAEGTPVALTSSANSSKTFSFSWTPQVESTTVYQGTKVVFAFADNTTIETETFDLTITNEPKFHFVKTMPTSKWYEPSDYTTPITFGKTNTADAQSFYVYNWGSAPLTVKSIAVPVGFTATPAEQFTVAAFDENDLSVAAQAVEIVFSATEAGEYSGDMVITYLNGANEEQTFTLAVSGTKLDPTKWYANFGGEANQWPAGSVYQSNVSTTYIDTNNYGITSSSTTNNLFVTPKLTATAGEKLSFDAKLYNSYSTWSGGKVVVYAAATRDEVMNAEEGTTRTQLFSVSGQDETAPMTADWQTFEVPALAGDNFYAFEISNRPYVDEIYGLKVAEVAHDWQIASSNIPAEAMQNVPATATVNILNRGLQDETDYTVIAHIGEETMEAAGTVTLTMEPEAAAAGTQITATFQSPKPGTFPVYIEVKAGDYSVATEPVDVTFAEEVATGDMAVGESAGLDGTTPLNLYYKNSETIALYTQDKLGLSGGEKINSITWKGVTTKAHTSTLKVYYQWTDDTSITSPASTGNYDVTGMTAAIEPTSHSWTVGGSADELQDQIVVNFPTPLVYEAGKSLLILVSSSASGYASSATSVQFEKSNITGFAFLHCNDGTEGTFTGSWSAKNLPLIHLGLEVQATTFAGTVKNADGEAIEGAHIMLVSADGDNVQYMGTSDAEGAYSVNVIQANRTYTATVEADGYVPVEETVEFAGGSVEKNFVLDVPPTVKYLKNPSFELADANGTASTAQALTNNGTYYGWQLPNLGASYVNISIGDASNCNGNAFGVPTAKDGNYYYFARRGWNSSSTADATMSTTMTNMAEGHYTLKMAYKGLDSWDNDHKSKGSYFKLIAKAGDTELGAQQTATFEAVQGNNAGANKFKGDANWKEVTLEFDVATVSDVTLNIVHHLVGGVRTDVVIDNLQITDFKSLADAALEALQAEIATAEALKTATRTEGLDDFNAAIETAKALLTSTDAAAINAGVEALKAAEEAFLTANLPMAEGTYYVYNPLTEKFLSRGNAYGTAAVVDDYGVAVNVAVSDLTAGKYTLSSFDNGANYGFDAWMYADAGGNNVRAYNINKVEGGVTLTNTGNNMLVYVYTNESGDKYRVAGNAIKGDNYTDDAQTVWQFVTPAERDRMVASREAAAKTAAYAAAGFSEDDELDLGEATEVSFTTGHAWTQTVVRSENNQPATNDNGTEMWQATGNYTQTISNLPAGLYRVTIQAFYRNGSADEDQARVATGYNTVLAYLEANGNKVQVKSWTSDKGEGNDPNSMGDAKAKFNEGKYLSEVYTYVGDDGALNLKVNNPAFIGNGWFIVGNVKYAKVEENNVIAGDVSGDGEVTTNDAVAVIPFVLEQAEPTPAQFKAADVNKSNTITISDAVGIVNIALNWNSEPVDGARGMVDASNDYIVVNGSEVGLMNATTFVGFQMDVTLSEGAQFNGAQLTSRTANHQVAWNRVADRTYRVVVFSAANEAITSTEGALLQLNISGNQQVSLGKIEFTDASARAYALGVADPTGIRGITADQLDAQIYTVGGVRSDKVRKGMNVIRQNNGKVTKRFVK